MRTNNFMRAVNAEALPRVLPLDGTGATEVSARATQDFSWFFRHEFPAVVRTASYVLHNRQAAEDVAQEAFIRLYKHWKKVSKYDKPEAWVRRVVIREAIRALRRQRFTQVLSEVPEVAVSDRTEDPELLKAIAKLSPQQRAAIVLFYLEDRPASEVGQIMDCSEATARVHVHRAKKRLSELLGEEVV